MNISVLMDMTVASIKMYFRDFTAIFFSLIFPVLFLVVFGLAFSNDSIELSMELYNRSESTQAAVLEKTLTEIPIFKESGDEPTLKEAKAKISDNELSFIVEIPKEFGTVVKGEISGTVNLLINKANSDINTTIESVINDVLNGFNIEATKQATGRAPIEAYTLNVDGVADENLDTIDYIVPGIIGFSIMSLGVFSVAQGFITYKSSGALRRLFVTPIHPLSFIVAQSFTRLIMVIINVLTMLVLAAVMFDFHMVGNVFSFLVISLFGAVLFLGMGYAIAGWAKDENQAAPVANILFFPMMFLGGTFFPRELFPEAVQKVAEFLPLSYLTDGLRLIANEGATVLNLGSEMLGLTIWIIISYAVAVKVFRWE